MEPVIKMAKIITITSGKGGVGKTSISLNLSLSLAAQGFKVCLFDADLGLANISILTGIYPEKNLESVIDGQTSINDILIKDYMGIDIIPGSNGVEKIADLTRTQTGNLINTFLDLKDYDFFIFDTSAGISSQVLSFCMASHEILLVATTEPTSLTDAYSMLKILSKYTYKGPIKIIINQVKAGRAAKKAYNQLKKKAARFLSVVVLPMGIIPLDKHVRTAVLAQTPFYILFPDSLASKYINSITDKLINNSSFSQDMSMAIFWEKCLSFIENRQNRKKSITHLENSIKDNSHDKTALAGIEAKLSEMMNELGSIKKILKAHHIVPDHKMARSPRKPKPIDNVVNFESRVIQKKTRPIPDIGLLPPKKRPKPIVRGRLRTPTAEELVNWDEDKMPVVITSAENI